MRCRVCCNAWVSAWYRYVATGTSSATGNRLFFALLPDAATRRKIAKVQRKLRDLCGERGRPVKPCNYHVTLAFLGNQRVDCLPRLLAMAAGLDMPPCRVQLNHLGSFPRAGVVWLGANETPTELCAFQARLMSGLEHLQIAYDRKPWQFHLTLYRDLRTAPVKLQPGIVNWRLDGFSLMESINTGCGVEYRQLRQWQAGSSARMHGGV
jgi:2'-5' RNA ligase